MNIVLLDEAQRRFEAEDEWWREHRDAKELFLDEFTQTLEHLRSWPEAGQRYRGAKQVDPARAHEEDPVSRLLLL